LFLGGVALTILAVVVVYAARLGEESSTAKPTVRMISEETAESAMASGTGAGMELVGNRPRYTFDFAPDDRPALVLGDDTGIPEEEWPKNLGDFAFGSEIQPENTPYADSIGGAAYMNADGNRLAYILVIRYETLSDFTNLVNSSVDIEFPDRRGVSVGLQQSLPVFHNESEQHARFSMLALRSYAIYIALVGTDETHPGEEELIELAEFVFEALTASGDGAGSIAAFDNGVLVCLPEAPSPDEPVDAFASLKDLGFDFMRVFALRAFNTSIQQEGD